MDVAKTAQLIDAAEELEKNEAARELFSLIVRLQKDGAAGVSYKFLIRYIKALQDFDNQFLKAVSDPDHFMSLSDLESMTLSLQEKQRVLARELAWEKAKAIDEAPLIEKKKESSPKKALKSASGGSSQKR
jgi:hypothetical protein